MKKSTRTIGAVIVVLAVLSQVNIATAAEIKVLCAAGFRTAIDDLGPKFERASGHKLVLSFGTLGAALKRLQGAETADLVILPKEGVDSLVKDGKAAAGNVTPLGRVGIHVGIPKGAAKPDISSPDALKRTLLAAKGITYLDPASGAASGIHFAKVLDQLGIAAEMKSKTVLIRNTDEIAALIANGKAEIAVGQMANLMTAGGIDIIGPLPGNLQDTIVFTAVVMNSAQDAGTAKALVSFLRTPDAVKVIKARGMEPG